MELILCYVLTPSAVQQTNSVDTGHFTAYNSLQCITMMRSGSPLRVSYQFYKPQKGKNS